MQNFHLIHPPPPALLFLLHIPFLILPFRANLNLKSQEIRIKNKIVFRSRLLSRQ